MTHAHSKQGRGRAAAKNVLTNAYINVFSGRGTEEEAQMVLADLAKVTGYYRRPRYGDWIESTKTPHGFELHSALSNARAEVVQHIMDFLTMTDDQLIALERAARLEAAL